MEKEFQYLLSEITIETDPKTGSILSLIDWHHRNYLEDVLVEIFDIEFDSLIENDDESVTPYFTDKADLNALTSTVDKINEFHKSKNREFDLPSGTIQTTMMKTAFQPFVPNEKQTSAMKAK